MLACSPTSVFLGETTTCTATVTDTHTTPTTPTGNVFFYADGPGDFVGSRGCVLGAGVGSSASCRMTYRVTDVSSGSNRIHATYYGDNSHAFSSASPVDLFVSERPLPPPPPQPHIRPAFIHPTNRAFLVGEVFGIHGGPLSRVKVKVLHSNGHHRPKTAVTDEYGAFSLELEPGLNRAQVELVGRGVRRTSCPHEVRLVPKPDKQHPGHNKKDENGRTVQTVEESNRHEPQNHCTFRIHRFESLFVAWTLHKSKCRPPPEPSPSDNATLRATAARKKNPLESCAVESDATLSVIDRTLDRPNDHVVAGDELAISGTGWGPGPIDLTFQKGHFAPLPGSPSPVVRVVPTGPNFTTIVKLPSFGDTRGQACFGDIVARQTIDHEHVAKTVTLHAEPGLDVLGTAGKLPHYQLSGYDRGIRVRTLVHETGHRISSGSKVCEGDLTPERLQSVLRVPAGSAIAMIALPTRANRPPPQRRDGLFSPFDLVVKFLHPHGTQLSTIRGFVSATPIILKDPVGTGDFVLPTVGSQDPRRSDPNLAHRAGIQHLPAHEHDTGFQGFLRREGDLTAENIVLDGGVLYVNGNLTMRGVRGSGSIIATGRISISGGFQLTADSQFALIAGGAVTLAG
jgi:hypothetical protein